MDHVNVYIEDLENPDHGTPKVNVKCTCGESHKKLLAEAIPWATQHVREHGYGRVHYKDLTRALSRYGNSIPLLGAARFSEKSKE